MLNVRKMEGLGGAMGLSESVSLENLSSTSSSNNIDVHMEKNSEYGALVILSASSYGKPDKVNNDQTTTGNATGVKMKVSSEWVAAGTISNAKNYANAVARYKDIYTTAQTKKAGDALLETQTWHDNTAVYNWFDTNTDSGLLRAYSKSIFSYDGKGMYYSPALGKAHESYYGYKYPTRAVVVSGEGL